MVLTKNQLFLYLCFLTLFCVINGQVIFNMAGCNKIDTNTCSSHFYFNISDAAVIKIKNVPSNSTFFVIQAHTFFDDVLLSNNSSPLLHYYSKGRNVGLVQVTSGQSNFTFYLFNTTDTSADDNVLIAVVLYSKNAPIPGGCNLVFDVENAPYQHINYSNAMIEVNAQAPSVFGHTCEENIFSLEIYRVYLPEGVINSQTYFTAIERMITVEDIRKIGWRVHGKTHGHKILRTLYSAYPGLGSIYAIVAADSNGNSAAYVPGFTYGCDINNIVEDCLQPVTKIRKAIFGLTIVWGLVMCFVSPLSSPLLFNIFVLGAIVVHLLEPSSDLLGDYKYHIVGGSAIINAITWAAMYYQCRKLSGIFLLLVNGFLIASFFFYVFIGDLYFFDKNLHYWIVFFGIVLLFAFLRVPCFALPVNVNGIIFGAFIIILAMDNLIGTYVRYTVINVIRRMSVDDFDLAIISPPSQYGDILLYCFYLTLFIGSCIFQCCLMPSPSGLSELTTPLI